MRNISDSKGGKKFISGVLVLSLSTFIVKVIGLAYKIPMMSLLGAEGMGYFNSAYEIYALLCVISTAGLPVALSMLIASCTERGDELGGRKVYRTAMAVFAVLGMAGFIAMFGFAEDISLAIENPDAYFCIMAISPALLCVCVASAVRGYFQGLCKMTPTAISQMIEAVCKLALGVVFAVWAIDAGYSIPQVAAFAILGLSVGTLISAVYLLILKFFYEKRNKGQRGTLLNESSTKEGILPTLFKIAIPITLSSAVLGITRIVDMALIMKRLQDIGYTTSGANEVYGSYTTLAVPVFSLIPSLITPVALALVPRLSAAIERRSSEGQSAIASSSMRITVFFAMPSSFGIAVYSRCILRMLFPNEAQAVSVASPLLSLLGISILFSCIITTSNAILQSYRQATKPIISMAIGALVKVISAYALIGIPSLGVYGAPISTLLCNVTITAINIYYINKYVPRTESVANLYLRPFGASVSMMIVSYAVYIGVFNLIQNSSIAFLGALAAALCAYFVFALVFGAVGEEDILMLPAGEKILNLIKKTGFWHADKKELAKRSCIKERNKK